MGDELLSDSFPEIKELREGVKQKGKAPSLTFTELFDKLCPMYMAMGMSYAEFYDGDPTLVIPYREAYLQKRRMANHDLWMQGRYIYDALCAVYPLFRFSFKGGEIRSEPYVEEPYPLTEKEAEERREREEKKQYEEMLRQHKAQVAAMRKRAGEKANGGRKQPD